METKALTHPDFRIFECIYSKGEVFEFNTDHDLAVTDMASQTIFVEGEATVERVSGTAGLNAPKVRKAGDSTYDKQKYTKIRAGRIRYTPTTDVFRFYCITPKSKQKHAGKTMQPVAGEQFDVRRGNYLFLASGSVSVEIGGSAITYDAPRMFSLTSQAKTTFTAVSDALLVAIPKDNNGIARVKKAA